MKLKWNGKIDKISKVLLVDESLDFSSTFNLKGKWYRPIGWDDNAEFLMCRVLEEV